MIRALTIALVLLTAAAFSYAAAWDYMYEGDVLPSVPINDTSEVTHFSPDDLRETLDIASGNYALHIVDTSANRSRYRIDLDTLYGPGVEAGTVETRQRFVTSSDMNNIAVLMRQDTTGASAEIRVGYYDAGDGRRGLWDTKSGEYLGPTDPEIYYKLRMVLDGPGGGRLYVNDSYFANLTAGTGASSRLAFGAGSTSGTGEVFVDYFRWAHGVKAGPGDASDPADPGELISPRTTTLPVATPDVTLVTIAWTTDVPSDSTVRWGTTWACQSTAYDAAVVTDHSVTISVLQPGTSYKFYVESRAGGDADVARSGIGTFTTGDTFRISAGPFVGTAADGASATVSWTTTFDADSRLVFRLKGDPTWTERYNSAPTTSHSLAMSSLTPNSTYEFYVLSTRSGAPDAQSPMAEFFTYVHSSVGSLLTNSDFESGSFVGWKLSSVSDVGGVYSGPWIDRIMPHSGNFLLGAESNGGARTGTVYQSATSLPEGDYVYASAWIRTYELDALGQEEHNSSYCQIGIDVAQDPGGNINPNAASIRWSTPVFTANAGPWTCIGVSAPRLSSAYATVLLRHVQTADGGYNVTCFDDVVLTTTPPLAITSGPTVTALTPTSAAIEWTTDAASTTFVQFGSGTLGNYTFTDRYADSTLTTTHTATIRTSPAATSVFQVGSASPRGLVLSAPDSFTTPMNTTIENSGFENVDTAGQPTMIPWNIFQYDINQLPRFTDPNGQPAGGPIDGQLGPYPYGNPGWNGITCEPGGESWFIGAYADGANKNGGVYQRVAVTPGQIYKATMRFLTRQDPIDGSHPASNTACAIAIDPTGGTNVLSSSLVWSFDKHSSVNGEWDEVFAMTKATADIITVFAVMEQSYADSVHLCAIDNVVLEQAQPVTGRMGILKNQPIGTPVVVNSAVLTYAQIPPSSGTPARLYVEETDRSAGIGIISTDPILWGTDVPVPGDRITADGTIAIVGGEAVVNNASLSRTPGSPDDIPQPLLMTQKRLGGGPFGIQPGVTGSQGLSTVGLLVKVAGKVTSEDYFGLSGWVSDQMGNTCAYIDDGSGLVFDPEFGGIKVIADPIVHTTKPIMKDDMMTAVGVSSVEEVNGEIHPVVLIGDWNTIQVVQP